MQQLLKDNLNSILNGHPDQKTLEPIFLEVLQYMLENDWKGACHESCGVLFLLLKESNINCEWRLGEVTFKEKKLNGNPIIFDHSWIVINNEIFDLSLCKTNYPLVDSPATIRNLNIETLGEPEVSYNIESGWEDSPQTITIKRTPLNNYFDNSPIHPTLGTWFLIEKIYKNLGKSFSLDELKEKYDGIYWK